MSDKCRWEFCVVPEYIDAHLNTKGRYTFHTECGNFCETMESKQPEGYDFKYCPFCGREIGG